MWFAFVGRKYGQVKEYTISLVRPVSGLLLSASVEIGYGPYVSVVLSQVPFCGCGQDLQYSLSDLIITNVYALESRQEGGSINSIQCFDVVSSLKGHRQFCEHFSQIFQNSVYHRLLKSTDFY